MPDTHAYNPAYERDHSFYEVMAEVISDQIVGQPIVPPTPGGMFSYRTYFREAMVAMEAAQCPTTTVPQLIKLVQHNSPRVRELAVENLSHRPKDAIRSVALAVLGKVEL